MARDPDDVDDATLRLVIATGIGPATLRRLRARFDDDAAIVGASASRIASRAGITPAAAEALRRAIDAADACAERHLMARERARLTLAGDADYPPALAELPDAPVALWTRGDPGAMRSPGLAIVGARKASPYGLVQAARFARAAVESNLAVVSGGAIGIDGAAHEAAIRLGGRTVAVLGCGLAHVYPRRHVGLFARIADGGGALVSDFPMNMPPRPGNFPARNRIISGLALAVLIVEAARRSGALITARLAAEEHGREVLALPGRVDASSSAGTNALLRDGGAAMVTDPAELLEHLRLFTPFGRSGDAGSARTALEDAGRSAVALLAASPAGLPLDVALERVPGGLATLTALEVRGLVERASGRWRLRVEASP